MKSNTPSAEAMTAQDHRINKLLEIISSLHTTLAKCSDFVLAEELNMHNDTTSNLLEEIDEAIWQADEVTK